MLYYSSLERKYFRNFPTLWIMNSSQYAFTFWRYICELECWIWGWMFYPDIREIEAKWKSVFVTFLEIIQMFSVIAMLLYKLSTLALCPSLCIHLSPVPRSCVFSSNTVLISANYWNSPPNTGILHVLRCFALHYLS